MNTLDPLTAPFPWYGGKSRAVDLVWPAFGNVPNYCEPFAGSLAMLLGRPHAPKVETVNDLDAYICNFWRAVAHDAEAVAHFADWPVIEIDLRARHIWLVEQRERLKALLEVDHEAHDAKVAGFWLWGICQWIGTGWCAPDRWTSRVATASTIDHDPDAKRPLLSRPGRGILKRSNQMPSVGEPGRGVHKKAPRTRASVTRTTLDVIQALCARLRNVRVLSGDWRRVLGDSTLGIDSRHGMSPTGIFLDPPYAHELRERRLYTEDAPGISAAVRTWALEHGDNPELRIALCGYSGEHAMPSTWRCVAWKSKSGYRGANRERIWFSPHCLSVVAQLPLFGDAS